MALKASPEEISMSAEPTILKPVPRQQTPAPRPIVPHHQAPVLQRPNRVPLQLELRFHRAP